MTKKQHSQLTVQKAVRDAMDRHSVAWQDVPEMQNAYERLTSNLKKIDAHRAALQTNLAALEERREKSRGKLVEELFPVTNVLAVYAYDTGNKKLGKLSNKNYTDLEGKSPAKLASFGGRILKVSEELLDKPGKGSGKKGNPALEDYGLTGAHLEYIREALHASLADDKAFSDAARERKRRKKKLKKRLKENGNLLHHKLDRMVLLFRDRDARFCADYRKAREKSAPVAEKTPAEITPKVPVAGAGKSPSRNKPATPKKGTSVPGKTAARKGGAAAQKKTAARKEGTSAGERGTSPSTGTPSRKKDTPVSKTPTDSNVSVSKSGSG